MRNRLVFLCVVMALLGAPTEGRTQIPAFPGAEGAGAFATGGRPVEKENLVNFPEVIVERRGVVYHVTTLASDPQGVFEGSLRYGLKNENFWYRTHPFRQMDINDPDSFDVTPRIIVFDVGGTINLGEVDITPMNITIAGQTAPGGITFYGGEFNPGHRESWDTPQNYPPKTNNLILRNFAVRTHDPAEKDGLWLAATNSIADHLSLAWYTDEGVSITDNARDVTVQHSIIGPGWNNPDGDGSQIEGKTPGADISVHHNLYIHNDARIPRVGEKEGPGVELDFRNNVIYNWNDSQAGYSTTSSAGHEPSFTNFVANYYIGGADNDGNDVIFNTGNNATRIYQSGNLLDRNFNGVADGTDLGWAPFTGGEIQQAAPYAVPHGVTQTPSEALDTVMSYAGANWWAPDFLDARLISQLQTFGQGTSAEKGQVLSSIDPADIAAVTGAPMQMRPSGWDTDNDGMPNGWELERGLDPDTPDWDQDDDADGYVNLEEYINELAAWPAPFEIEWTGGDARFAVINHWSITRDSPHEAPTTTHWQPSRFDTAVIRNGVVTMDAPGQHAGRILLGGESGDNGTLSITDGWLKVVGSGAGLSTGEIVIGSDIAGSTATLNLAGGELYAESLSKNSSGQFNFTGGKLHAGQVNFDLAVTGGTVAPGSSIGITTIEGNAEFSNNSTIQIELAGIDSDLLVINGDFDLGSDSSLEVIELSELSATSFLLAQYTGQLSGEFASVTPGYFVDYNTPGEIRLLLSQAVLAGDYNDDGLVNAADYVVWRNNLGEGSLPNETASPGEIDEADYEAWRENFGAMSSAGQAHPANIPEPATIAIGLLAMGSGFFFAARMRSEAIVVVPSPQKRIPTPLGLRQAISRTMNPEGRD